MWLKWLFMLVAGIITSWYFRSNVYKFAFLSLSSTLFFSIFTTSIKLIML